ncbi:MAG: M1 family aminopeptidase [Candidatus Cloacimonadales bacterium]|nr:M1 family aminopeptidase [Candidatus Cloacimonadales bacterium]
MKKLFILFLFISFISILIAAPTTTNYEKINPDRIHRAKNFVIYTEETRADSAHGFDVLTYDIALEIFDATDSVTGSVIATVEAEETITEISYELTDMTVNAVLLNGSAATYDYSNDLITIQLGTMNPGDVFTTQVDYSGFPTWNGLGMYFSASNVFTISDPNASRYWWPCYDHPWDKAVTDLHITARDDWLVASNGLRTSIVDLGNGTKTHHWDCDCPMATYLVSVTCQSYVELNDTFGDIPIRNFVPSNLVTSALEDFSNLPFMMEVFSEKYGMYPFEKYGNAVTNFATYSAMEHQTMTTMDNDNITGNHGHEMTIAHELAHQWYGDCLTHLTWCDVWLSEGFATYSEAVYMQAWQGFEAMVNYIEASIQNYYKNWAGNTPHTIYNPANPNLYFTPVTYEKAASVLHMIRLKVGDEVFWNIMQTFFSEYMNSNVITSDFQSVCETVSGLDFDQFFTQWIYGSGMPSYEYTYFFNPYLAVPRIMTYVQTHSNSATEFYLDIPVHIYSPTDQDSVLVQGTPNTPLQTIAITEIPVYDDVEFDPNNWVLMTSSTFRGVSINNAYSADEQVIIFWEEFWPEVGVEGYNLYRSESPTGDFLQINPEIITGTSYIDNDVVNGTTYYYKLKAVKDQTYETPFSEVYVATPINFPLDQGILVIDETKDGNGSVGNPDDETVDEFYETVIPTTFATWDYEDEGIPPLETLANYSTIIWHDDDFAQNYIEANINNLGCYLAAGGNLIISGWKTADYIPDSFKTDFLGCNQTQLISSWEFTGASSAQYPELMVNPDKINPAFNGTLPYVCIFPEAVNGIYNFEASGGSQYIGEVCALKDEPNGTFVLLGFPLFFLFENEVSGFMYDVLAEIGEVGVNNNIVPANKPYLSNYPNPFNPSTTISFSSELNEQLELFIYNLKGQKVKSLNVILSGVEGRGEMSVVWNGTDDSGKPVSSGIYFAKLKSGNVEMNRKMLLMK